MGKRDIVWRQSRDGVIHPGRRPLVGVVIEGTHDLATLLQAFRDELEWVTMSGNIQNVRSSAARAIVGLSEQRVGAGEFANEVLKELVEALNNYGPDDLYFGVHPGDGACFGWWRTIDEPGGDSFRNHGAV